MSLTSKGMRDTQQAMAIVVDGLSQRASIEAASTSRYEKTGSLTGHSVLIAPHIAAQARVRGPRIRNFGR